MGILTQNCCIHVLQHNQLHYLIAIHVPITNVPFKSHVYATYKISSCVIWNNYVSICFMWTYCNQQSDQEQLYIHLHYWCIPLNKYAHHITHIFPTACLLWSTYRPSITAHISKQQKIHFNLPCYCHMCPSSKYAPEMPHLCNIPKLLDMH